MKISHSCISASYTSSSSHIFSHNVLDGKRCNISIDYGQKRTMDRFAVVSKHVEAESLCRIAGSRESWFSNAIKGVIKEAVGEAITGGRGTG